MKKIFSKVSGRKMTTWVCQQYFFFYQYHCNDAGNKNCKHNKTLMQQQFQRTEKFSLV